MRLEGGEGLELARLPTLLQVSLLKADSPSSLIPDLSHQVGEKIGKQMMIDLNSSMSDDV